jgi:O-antigen ligase
MDERQELVDSVCPEARGPESYSPLVCLLIVACVPALGLGGFFWPSVADIAAGILVLIGVLVLLLRDVPYPRAAVALAAIWILYFVFAAGYATMLDLPGQHWRSFGKHVPIALGPFFAIAIVAARDRLRMKTDTFVVMFFTAVVIGTTLMLIRNGAPRLFETGWPEFSGAMLGNVNRNFAALACGLTVLTSASLIQYAIASTGGRPFWIGAAVLGLTLVLLFAGALLIVLRSRAGYAATGLGLAVWSLALVFSAMFRKDSVSKLGWIVPLVIVTVLAGLAAEYVSVLSDRLIIKGSSITNLQIIGELLRGGSPTADLDNSEERLQLAKVAIDLIRERPWLGWGPDVGDLIRLHAPWPMIQQLNQFHNGYLQSLVSYGFIGTSLLVTLLVAILRAAWRHHDDDAPSDRLSPSLVAATISITAYLVVFNLTETVLLVKPAALTAAFLAALASLPPATPGRIRC